MKTGISVNAVFAVASISALAVATSLFGSRVFGQVAGSQTGQLAVEKPAWLDGAGKDLRIRVHGEVLDESGVPANDCKVVVRVKTNFGTTDLPAVVERNQFQFWVPVGEAGWFNVHLHAASADGRRVVSEAISGFEVRRAAIDGLKLTVKPPERTVFVRVVDQGKPVPDAFVVAEVVGAPLTARTNGMGFARFPLQNRDKLYQLTAWTHDYRIGGYSFNRDPPRDPSGSKFTIELEPCRPQVIRIINAEDKAPIPNLDFVLTVGTGAPNYQFPGSTPGCEMKTDDKGEAVYRWFPDWKTHGSYVEIVDPRWVKVAKEKPADAADDTTDGAILVRIRKSRFETRKRVVGQITSTESNVAGFFVEMWSFQGEEERRSDVRYAFTDENGRFAGDYLPGSTYCIYVNDARFVSNIIDLIPHEPAADKINTPSLTISKGQPVEVTVTSGPAKAPVAHQWIQLETPHDYLWRENGTTRNGAGSRRWEVTTDERGRAHTFALPGEKIRGSIYTPEWRANESVDVKTDGATKLEFHREIAHARKIVGRLLIVGDVEADLDGAVIEIGSVDGQTRERKMCSANERGEFEFESKASQLGFYARTQDATVAAVEVIDRLDQPLELHLKPTGELRGQLLGKEDLPLERHAVHASLHVSGMRDFNKPFPTSFLAATFDAETDSEGNYTLSGLPSEVSLDLTADPIDGPARESYLQDFYLVPDESRSRTISRLWKPERKIPFGERYAGILRDCRLSNFHALVILMRPADDTRRFVDSNFMDYETTREIMSFMQIQGPVGDQSPDPEVAEFARSKNWPLPENGRILAIAIDSAGRDLGRIEIDSKDPAGAKLAADFVRKHAPVQIDAKEKWDEAFALAGRSGRKVWVRISQRYCRPCFLLSRWFDDQKKPLDEDYVFLKIDDVRDLHGNEVAKRLERSEEQGVPFHAIFDSNGTILITSEGPLGNIGHPSGVEGKKHLRRMLLETREKLTEKQLDEIVATLND
jgi:hypothetical protein